MVGMDAALVRRPLTFRGAGEGSEAQAFEKESGR